MVGFGQTICAPINPMCGECLNRQICPYKGKVRKSPSKRQLSPLKSGIAVKDEVIEDDNNLIIKKNKECDEIRNVNVEIDNDNVVKQSQIVKVKLESE